MKSGPQNEPDLPASLHTEVAVLGAMLLDADAVKEAARLLDVGDFYLDSHQRIYRVMLYLAQERTPVDITTVRAELQRRHEIEAIGGPAYLFYLTEGIPRNLYIGSYARIVKDKAMLRKLLTITQTAAIRAGDQGEDAAELTEAIRAQLDELTEDATSDDDLERVGDYTALHGHPEALFDKLTTHNGIMLGFHGLDKIIGGLQAGDLMIVAARPSMGKTAWACNVAQSLALRQYRTTFFSLEQKRLAMIRRMLSSSTRVDYRRIREGWLRQMDRTALMEQWRRLAAAPLYIDDRPGQTVSQLRAKCTRLKKSDGLDIILVDQLSKISRGDCKQRDKRLQIGEQTEALKLMGQELGVPVVVFNQLRRGDYAKSGDSRTPQLDDLKESGNIEEDADVVVFLHNKEQMIVAKNREGELGTVEATYQGRCMLWDDPTPEPVAAQASFEREQWIAV